MKNFLLLILTILFIGLVSSCDYLQPNAKYADPTKEFMTGLVQKDYTKCISLMELSTKPQTKAYMDTIKSGLDYFYATVTGAFGKNLHYSFLKSQKTGSLAPVPIPNTTTILLQVDNGKDFGVIEALINIQNDKIMSIKPDSLDKGKIKQEIPDRGKFWWFGMLAAFVLLFNIYTLIRVYRSDIARKWVSYIIIIVLNLFTIGYSPIQGIFFHAFSLQFFLGVYYIKLGYLGSAFIIGVPVGSIYTLWQLKTGKYTKSVKAKAPADQIKGKRFKGKS